ncbi:hypothetical protein, partial [Pseudomonas abyssi]|uniref:hypothetical protein n=1 Tax=Pseudomonas abyssi TaxID=170540 RepID=UPI001F32246D
QLPASSFQLPASSFQLPASSFQLPASSFQALPAYGLLLAFPLQAERRFTRMAAPNPMFHSLPDCLGSWL